MKARFFGGADEGQAAFRHDRWSDYICWALISAGAGLRIGQYLQNRSLGLDESMLAVNRVERGFGALHTTLDFNQSAWETRSYALSS